jgi:hypothetical protein
VRLKYPYLSDKLSKKGLSQVDWAISLGIFLIYLSLFFILVKPLVMPSRNIDTSLDSLQSKFISSAQTVVQRVPIFVMSDIRSGSEFVIANFSYSGWNTSDIAMSEDYFAIDEGKIFFIMNTSETKRALMYYPFDKRRTESRPFLSADESRVQYGDFSAWFDEEVLRSIFYKGAQRVFDIDILVEGKPVNPGGVFSKTDVFAKYKVRDHVNLSTYIPADNTRIYSYFVSDDPVPHNLTFTAVIYNYTRYYIDPVHNGRVVYPSVPSCKDYSTGFIDFNDVSTGVAFFTSGLTDMHVCRNSTNILLSFDLEAGKKDAYYAIFIHEGDHSAVKGYPLAVQFGVRDELKGISQGKVSDLKAYDYAQLKDYFRFPQQRDFNITVVSADFNESFGKKVPERLNVYARTSVVNFAFDKELNTPTGDIHFVVW